MLAVVKKHHTKQLLFEVRGEIPPLVVHYLKEIYGPDVEVLSDDEEIVSVTETSWFKGTLAATTPGDVLKIYRQNSGITQTELGKRMGNISRQKISDMERGKRPIGKEMAKKFSQILKVPVERFL